MESVLQFLLGWAGRLSGGLHAWIAAEQGRFAPWLAVGMMVGATAYFLPRHEPPLWWGVAAVASGIAAWGLARRWPGGWGLIGHGLALAGLATALGFLSAQLATRRARPLVVTPHRAVIVTGTVQRVDLLPKGRRLSLAGAGWPGQPALARLIHVRLRNDDPLPLAAGDQVRIRALLRSPSPPSMPGGWDLQRDAFYSGLGASGWALGPASLVRPAAGRGLRSCLNHLRDTVANRFITGMAAPAGAIAATLFTGEQTGIPLPDRAAFRDSGLAHLLAVAGLHIGLVMAIVFGAVRRLLAAWGYAALRWPCKQIALLAALAVGGFYLLLTGAHVPIIRSFAMASLVVAGLIAGRRALSLRGLALAAVVLLLAEPEDVVGASFQMSFAAVAALIAGYEAARPWLARLRGDGGRGRRLALHLSQLALTSLLAGTASMPFAAYHFGHVPLYFVLANLLAVPITGFVIMPAGLVALALMPVGLEKIVLWPMGWGIRAVLWIGRSVSAWPAATLAAPHAPGWGLAVVALGLAWVLLWRSQARWWGVVPVLAGLLSPVLATPPDIMVSSDARLIGWRTGDGLRVRDQGGSAFTLAMWRANWAPGAVGPLQPGRFGPESAPALLLDGDQKTPDCRGIAVILDAEPARDACPGVPRVDRFTVWRDGAQALWLRPGGARILSDRAVRGDRPWVPPPPEPRRRAPVLPLAATETLPP